MATLLDVNLLVAKRGTVARVAGISPFVKPVPVSGSF